MKSEKESEKNIEQPQVYEKRRNIGRSSSLSNIPKKNISTTQRRCSSVPPTITVQYTLPSTTYNYSAHSCHQFNDGSDSHDGDFSGPIVMSHIAPQMLRYPQLIQVSIPEKNHLLHLVYFMATYMKVENVNLDLMQANGRKTETRNYAC